MREKEKAGLSERDKPKDKNAIRQFQDPEPIFQDLPKRL
jgi:hypothetical protein